MTELGALLQSVRRGKARKDNSVSQVKSLAW
jgi:hypothetical protein